MIKFLADRKRRIVLVCYSSELSVKNLAELDAMAAAFAAREGPMDGIIDFRDMPTFNVPAVVVADRGKAPRRMSGRRRIFIVKDKLAFGILRIYGAYQDNHGEDVPDIVYSLDEALTALDAKDATFEPV
jgi:hypothetical protein